MLSVISEGQTDDRFAAGDISGRHSDLSIGEFLDHNLPLFGVNKIHGNGVRVTLKDGTVLCSRLRKYKSAELERMEEMEERAQSGV